MGFTELNLINFHGVFKLINLNSDKSVWVKRKRVAVSGELKGTDRANWKILTASLWYGKSQRRRRLWSSQPQGPVGWNQHQNPGRPRLSAETRSEKVPERENWFRPFSHLLPLTSFIYSYHLFKFKFTRFRSRHAIHMYYFKLFLSGVCTPWSGTIHYYSMSQRVRLQSTFRNCTIELPVEDSVYVVVLYSTI